MSQADWGTINPDTKSGTALASDLDDFKSAVHTMHSGSTAPSYVATWMLWADTTAANAVYRAYDGAQSVPVFQIDAANNVARCAIDSDGDSYLASPSDDQFRFVVGGVTTAYVNAAGFGFGLAPSYSFDSLTASNIGARITSTFATRAGPGPYLVLDRNHGTGAANDVLGAILLRGRNAAGSLTNFGVLGGLAVDVTSGSEDGYVYFQCASPTASGALRTRQILGGNSFSCRWYDETTAELMRLTDAGTLSIGTTAATAHVTINSGATNSVLALQSSDTTAALLLLDNTTTTTGNFPIAFSRAGDVTTLHSGGLSALTIAADAGVYTPTATGGSQGPDTINAAALYDDGVAVLPTQVLTDTSFPGFGSGGTNDITGIRSNHIEIRIVVANFNFDGGGNVGVRLGDSGGIESTGYVCNTYDVDSDAASTFASSTDRHLVAGDMSSIAIGHGEIVITRQSTSSNSYTIVSTYAMFDAGGSPSYMFSQATGTKTLTGGPLDRIQIVTSDANGWSAGSAVVLVR